MRDALNLYRMKVLTADGFVSNLLWVAKSPGYLRDQYLLESAHDGDVILEIKSVGRVNVYS